MRHRFIAFVALALLVSPLFADSIDDAEAKSRGVSVTQIQLEHEQKKTAELQKQILKLQSDLKAAQDHADADLKAVKDSLAKAKEERDANRNEAEKARAELEALKTTLSPAQQSVVAAKAAEDKKKADDDAAAKARIDEAISKHLLTVGMTLDMANQSLGCVGYIHAENGKLKFYDWYPGHPVGGEQRHFSATVVDGKITACSVD
jgi:septal ring factor EnvC (AmiA/AmiB activator)